MPHNTTVSHISPLVSYIPRSAWYEADLSDPDLDKYSNKSYHFSNSTASVTFSWWGTGIWVYGGRRKWSGEYTVSVDNQAAETFPPYAGGGDGDSDDNSDSDGDSDGDEFQQVLYGAPDLPYAHHQIRITNPGASPDTQSTLDIDYFVYETTLVAAGKILHNDTDLCIWNPKENGVWQVDETSHTTENDLGSLELSFTVCSSITLYGYLEQNSAPLSVSVDGWASTPVTPNTNIVPLIPGILQVLYTKSDLQEGSHTLRVQNNPLPNNRSGSRMSIAYSQVLSLSDGVSQSSGGPPSNGLISPSSNSDSNHRTVVLAASFSALGAFLISIIVWRLIVLYLRRKQARKEMAAPRPFYARTNPSSPPQSPRLRQRPGRQRQWRRSDDDPEAQTAILPHTASRVPSTRRTRRPAHRRPPSDIEFARSWASSRFDSDSGADAYAQRHGYSRSYDDLGYPRTATYPYPDDVLWDSELTFLRHARNTSAASSSASAHTIRDSFSMHATAPTSPSTPVFDRDHDRSPAPLPVTLPLRINSRRQQQRRPRSIEKPPLDVEEQLAIFTSISNARRAGAGGGGGADTALRLVGSPATSLPSSRPSTATGTGVGSLVPRPLPPPPVPPLPSHLRAPVRSPGQSTFNPWDVEVMGQPPPYRLLDMH